MKSIKIGYQHEVIQHYKKVKKGSNIHLDQFVVEGIWAYEKLLHTGTTINYLMYCDSLIQTEKEKHILKELSLKAKATYEISEKTMKRLNSKEEPSCLIMICSIRRSQTPYKKIIVLDGLENPGNIGTIFRTSDGAGIDAVFVVNQRARINQYKIVKASMGGYFNVPWRSFDSIKSCAQYLKTNGFDLILANPGDNNEKNNPDKVALVVGNERYGLSREWFNYDHNTISIPMNGCCDSLNVGVAASILMYEIAK